MSDPQQHCLRPHGLPCLAHVDVVISDRLPSCQVCAPQLPAAKARMEAQKAHLLPPTPGIPLISRQRPTT